jgi:ribulose 1,5-bisphosphate carboxylase large subunit-like protein
MVGAWPFGRSQRAMPILQGGKMPAGLPAYRAAIGSDDYMLIVASWVDAYPDGLQAGARVFREAVDAQAAA